MRLASLLSGGKDSVYSTQLAMEAGHEVVWAVTIVPQRDDSYMYHVPNLWLTRLQAESMGVEHVVGESSGEKEAEVADLADALEPLEIDGVVVGAIASNYQFSRVSRVCGDLGIDLYAPIWGADPQTLLPKMLSSGYRIMIVGVYADGLGPEWLGRILDHGALAELKELESKRGVAISFEGGEAETLVLDCPAFQRAISVERAERRWDTCRGEYLVLEASLVPKKMPR